MPCMPHETATGEPVRPTKKSHIEVRELDPERIHREFAIRIPLLEAALERSARARRVSWELLRMEFTI